MENPFTENPFRKLSEELDADILQWARSCGFKAPAFDAEGYVVELDVEHAESAAFQKYLLANDGTDHPQFQRPA